jgi:predicted AAA+ superfamily ATPase
MNLNFRQIIAEQRDEVKFILEAGWVPRDKEESVSAESRLLQIITGVRRSGKSTLAHRALQNFPYAYLNLDDERLIGMTASDLDQLIEALYGVYGKFERLILDEIQNVEGWQLFVNRLQRNNFKVILTGSNSKLLSSELATHLTGRYSVIELLPFSFKEFLAAKGVNTREIITAKDKGLINGFFEQYLTCGGFPDIIAGESKYPYISTLFNAIVTRDIMYRHKIWHIRSLREMAVWLAGNSSTEISYNRLKKIFNLGSDNTAKNYISFMEEAWLFLTLPKFSFKNQESLRYRKIYMVDIAFFSLAGALTTPNQGHLLENIVFLELFRRRQTSQYELYYYKKTAEVDFVIYQNRTVLELIQVCWTIRDTKTRNREVRALQTAALELNPQKMTIVTMDEKLEIPVDGKTIEVVPVTEWLIFSDSRPG